MSKSETALFTEKMAVVIMGLPKFLPFHSQTVDNEMCNHVRMVTICFPVKNTKPGIKPQLAPLFVTIEQMCSQSTLSIKHTCITHMNGWSE